MIFLRIKSVVQSEDGSTLGNFLLSKNECLATLDRVQSSSLACTAFELENNLLGSLGLLSEDGLGLTSVSFLFGIISSLSLSDGGVLTFLVLRHLVNLMLFAFTTVSSFRFGSVHLKDERNEMLPFILY